MKIGYGSVQKAHSDLVKEVMGEFEQLMKKYKISLNEYHEFRALLKSRLARLDNNWKTHFLMEINRILSLVTDEKFSEPLEEEKEKWVKRINLEGERLETYGHNISR
jgi:hypothetical protein